jgi:transmembrane sensor
MNREPNTIEAEATRWAIRLDAGPLSVEEQAQLDQWVASDPRRHGALVRARSAWLDADRLAALAGAGLVVPGKAGIGAPEPASSHRGRMRFLIAASVAALAIALGTLWYGVTFRGQVYASEIGEVRRIELPDGSQLTLNTNTHARVRFQESGRTIELERGEALFKVAHDTSRPFIVRASDVHVRAVGTAFTVRVDDARVDVLVTEGVVDVSRAGTAGGVQRIAANQRAVIASSHSRVDIEPIDSAGMTRRLAWREGMLAFAGEPLSIAVAEINRYSRQALYVDDPELAARPVIGIFRANDAEGFANAAAATFKAEVVHADGAILLRASSVHEPSVTR